LPTIEGSDAAYETPLFEVHRILHHARPSVSIGMWLRAMVGTLVKGRKGYPREPKWSAVPSPTVGSLTVVTTP